jgi:hypothetical protein
MRVKTGRIKMRLLNLYGEVRDSRRDEEAQSRQRASGMESANISPTSVDDDFAQRTLLRDYSLLWKFKTDATE